MKTISPLYEAFYIESMLSDADIAISVMDAVRSARTPQGFLKAIAIRELLVELQIFIQHAGALSRYFWPARADHDWRGKQLRTIFSVQDTSPLKDRSLRNALEHFDERLDIFLEGVVVGTIVPEYAGEMPLSSEAPRHFFRAYFPAEQIFELLGNRFDLKPLEQEIERLRGILLKMRETGRMTRVGDLK